MTEEEARMIGRAIREEARMVGLPTDDPVERRAICLKLAIETKGVAFSLKNDADVSEAADQVVVAAKIYEAYVSGEAAE